MQEIPRIADSTVATLATFPPRRADLAQVIGSLIDQVDHIFVYLNGYDSVPEELEWEKITAILGKGHEGDLSANGKAVALDYLENCYVLMCDDDFIYPPDYVSKLKEVIDAFGKRVGVSVHGSIFAPSAVYYYERAQIYNWKVQLHEHKVVNLVGSGTFGFHQESLPLRFDAFRPNVMVDLTLSVAAKRRGIPLLAIARPAYWIQHLNTEGLWESFSRRLTHHTIEMIEQGPWSFESAAEAVRNMFLEQFGAFSEERAKATNLDAAFVRAAIRGKVLGTWCETETSLEKRRMLFNVLSDD